MARSSKFACIRAMCSLAAIGVLLAPKAIYAQPFAQQGITPSLHQRRENSSEYAESSTGNAEIPIDSGFSQSSTLPRDVSGAYSFDHRNESVEIDLHRSRRNGRVQLSGYISRLGDDETDENTPLTFFFDHTAVAGTQIEFQTRVVHGVWYSFSGTIVRGSGQTRADKGYYVLHGVLLEHHPEGGLEKSANESLVRRTVNFKSLGK